MNRWMALLVGGAAAACGSQHVPANPGPNPDDLALRWRVSQGLWGTEVFEVTRAGAGHYSFEPVQGRDDPPKSFDVSVTRAQLDDITRAVIRTSLCQEQSSRDGIPDEGMPSLELWLEGATCTVSLWDGEWRDRPGPQAVAEQVEALHQSAQAAD